MRTVARILVALAACVSLQVAVPVSADVVHPSTPASSETEIGCAARWYRAADGSVTQEILC